MGLLDDGDALHAAIAYDSGTSCARVMGFLTRRQTCHPWFHAGIPWPGAGAAGSGRGVSSGIGWSLIHAPRHRAQRLHVCKRSEQEKGPVVLSIQIAEGLPRPLHLFGVQTRASFKRTGLAPVEPKTSAPEREAWATGSSSSILIQIVQPDVAAAQQGQHCLGDAARDPV